jgi:SAGA-associated factor 29
MERFPLQEGRHIAFHPPPSKGTDGETDENTWILARVIRCISSTKYEVLDVEPQEVGQPGV